jgi:hypothetical protein
MADKITKIAVSDTINDLKQETNGDTTKVDTPTEAPIEEKARGNSERRKYKL